MATLYESFATWNTSIAVFGAYWRGQTFTPTVAHTITSVKLLLRRVGTVGTLTVSIRATDVDGKPTGADLASGSMNGNSISTEGGQYEITFGAGTPLVAGTKYAIVVRAPDDSDDGNNVFWYANGPGGYTNGQNTYSPDSGVTWTLYDSDFTFEDWGDPPTAPTVTTQVVTTISGATATGNGTITSIGGASVTQHGHCWNTTGTPTTADSKTTNGAGSVGVFTSAITGLTAGTKYYVRAYATNAGGTSYGNEVIFWADLGTVKPSDPQTRVTALIHRYDSRKGIYQLEVSLGDTTSLMALPYELTARRATAESKQEQDTASIVKESVQKAAKESETFVERYMRLYGVHPGFIGPVEPKKPKRPRGPEEGLYPML